MAKVLISIDDALLRQVDERARALGLSRSAFVARLAEADLAPTRVDPARRRAVQRARAAIVATADPVPGDSTDFVRAMRDAR